MRVLLQKTDEAAFQVLLQQFLSHLLEKYPQFYTYFTDSYVSCTKKWAFCFRKGATVNTNMFVEAFHRKLKTVYFQKKQNRRVDRLVFTLLKISQDLIFEGLRKDEIGKRSYRKCEIRKRCQTASLNKREPQQLQSLKTHGESKALKVMASSIQCTFLRKIVIVT